MKESYVILRESLFGEYRDAFDKVVAYGTTNLISADFKEDRLMGLLDNLLSAQNDKKDVTAIVGEDINVFCKNFYSDYKMSDRLKGLPGLLKGVAWLVFIFSLIDFAANLSDGIWTKSTWGYGLVGLVFGCVINLMVYLLIRPIFLKLGNAKVANGMIVALTLACFVVVGIIGATFDLDKLIQLPIIIEIVIAGLYLLVFYAVTIAMNKKTYGTFLKPKDDTISFAEAMDSNLKYTLPEVWLKSYTKENNRQEKKGKPCISEEAYLKRIEKKTDFNKNRKIYIVSFSVLLAIMIAHVAFDNGSAMIMDTLVFSLILIVVESLFLRFILKVERTNYLIYQNMKKEMEAEHLTLSAYVDKLHGK